MLMKILVIYIFLRQGHFLLLITSGMALAKPDYGSSPSRSRYLLRSAGSSRQHSWIGPGRSMPLHVPKPFFISKWIPHMDPTYRVSWVSTLPPSILHSKGASKGHPNKIRSGFGPPKGSSVVHSAASHVVPQYDSLNNNVHSNGISHHITKSPPVPNFAKFQTQPKPSHQILPSVSNFNSPHNPSPSQVNIHSHSTNNNAPHHLPTNTHIQPLIKAPQGDPLPISSHDPVKDINTNFLTAGGDGESSYTHIK